MPTQQPNDPYGLGDRIREFRPKNELLVGIIFIGFAFFCGATGTILELGGYRGGIILAFGGFGVIFLICLYLYFQSRQNKVVTIYRDGLAYWEPDRLISLIRWEDLHELRIRAVQKVFITPHSFHLRGDHRLTLTKKDGTTVSIENHYPKMNELVNMLWHEINKHQAPAALEAFKQGKTLSFGPLTLNKDGIDKVSDHILLPWQEVENITILGGDVVIRTRSGKQVIPWLKVKVEEVPNLPVFIALIGQQGANKLLGGINLTRTQFGI